MFKAEQLYPTLITVASVLTGCVAEPASEPTSDVADGKGDSANDLCSMASDAKFALFRWANRQPTPNWARADEVRLDAVVETSRERFTVAVTRIVSGGPSNGTEEQFLLSLDANGRETARAWGRYIDRIGPDKYLLDYARASGSFSASSDPWYYRGLELYAANRYGGTEWEVTAPGNTRLSKVFRIGEDHHVVVGIPHDGQPELTYFDSDGNKRELVTGDPRECVQQEHRQCWPECATTGGSADAACPDVPTATSAFDKWAAAMPRPSWANFVENRLDAVVERTAEEVTVAVTRIVGAGTTYTEERFLLSLDAQGRETGRAWGRYIDRIGPNKYLLDAAVASGSFGSSNNPFYHSPLELYASDRQGQTLWEVAAPGNTQLSKVFRIDARHFLVVGTYHDGQPELTFFDAQGTKSEPPVGDPRECAQQN